jgi:circadian clock protein KaiC
LETHLARIFDEVAAFQPDAIVVDPISNLTSIASDRDVKAAMTRLIDHLKHQMITVVFTDLSGHAHSLETTSTELSSLMDTWILLRDIELNGERNRGIYILKSRGMSHSNQIRELKISSQGLDLIDVYTGSGGVLTGTARVTLEAREAAERIDRERKLEQLRTSVAERQLHFERQAEDLERQFEHDLRVLQQQINDLEASDDRLDSTHRRIAVMRGKDRG